MEVFILVVESGSFSSAARTLDSTPSSVSRLMDRLEKRLGIRLLLRTTRTLTLTDEGHSYYGFAKRIIDQINEFETVISNQSEATGKIRISAAVSHGRFCIAPLIEEFSTLYPKIDIDLSLTDNIVDVAAGDADIAIRFGHLTDSQLTAKPLCFEHSAVVASPKYLQKHGVPSHPNELRDHNCLTFNFDRGKNIWPFQENNTRFSIPITGTASANNGEALGSLACSGLGIARIAVFSIQQELEEGRLVELLSDYHPKDKIPVQAVYVGGKTIPKRLRIFLDFIHDKLST